MIGAAENFYLYELTGMSKIHHLHKNTYATEASQDHGDIKTPKQTRISSNQIV